MEKDHEWFGEWMVPALLALAIVLAFITTTVANAHSWYDSECCGGNDCAIVESTSTVLLTGEALPSLVVTTKHGTAVVPHSMKIRDSKDGHMHACMVQGEMSSGMELLCIYAPPSL